MTSTMFIRTYFLIFLYCRWYIDDKTRIEFGFHIKQMSHSYQLQRKTWWGWRTTAWTYLDVKGLSEETKKYLLTKENDPNT